MDKRIVNERPLCVANNNTCMNLAGIRGRKTPTSPLRYHTRCDKHRRDGHDAKAFRNPNSKRYIPLDKCDMCNAGAEDRHRIVPGTDYLPENTLRLCKDCHRKIHKLYDKLASMGFNIVSN